MMKEFAKRLKSVAARIGTATKFEERTSSLKGYIKIEGCVDGKVAYAWEDHNVIVNSASILIARLLKDCSESGAGISFLAVGTGGDNWNIQDPPAPTINQQTLENELGRKAISPTDTYFVDPNTGEPVGNDTPTNIVDYSVTYSESEVVGAIVELGLFGGDATGALNSGTMINYRTFPVINKTSSMTLSIIVRITA
jgi:hypothetical protein